MNGEEKKMPNKKDESTSRLANFTQILGTLLALVIGTLLIVLSKNPTIENHTLLKDSLLQLGIAFVVATVTYYAYQIVIRYRTEDFFKNIIGESYRTVGESYRTIEDNIKNLNNELEKLYQYNTILEGAKSEKVGMVEIFADRHYALKSIYSEIQKESDIKLMGIALRDFFSTSKKGHVAGEDGKFSINSYLDAGKKKVEVLLLNPYSEYAQIRAAREDGKEYNDFINYKNSTLFKDVNLTLTFLEDKIQELKDNNNITIKVKMYRSINPIFIVITSKYVYVEHYNLGIEGEIGGGKSPVIKFLKESDLAKNYIQHFEYISTKQSQDPEEIKINGLYGAFYNIKESKLINLFTKRDCPTLDKRIRFLIKKEDKIDICGISLRDFLHPNGILDQVFRDLKQRDKEIKKIIRVLLLDPFSEPGQMRSKREQGLDIDKVNGIIKGNLFQDIIRSLRHHSEQKKVYENISIEIKLYSVAPSCFIFKTNESLITEQYHFGAKNKDLQQNENSLEESTFVARRIPISEYSNDCSMYDELTGHFDFIWESTTNSENKEKWADKNKIDLKSYIIENAAISDCTQNALK